MDTLKHRFPHLNLTSRSVQRFVDMYKQQTMDKQTAGNIMCASLVGVLVYVAVSAGYVRMSTREK